MIILLVFFFFSFTVFILKSEFISTTNVYLKLECKQKLEAEFKNRSRNPPAWIHSLFPFDIVQGLNTITFHRKTKTKKTMASLICDLIHILVTKMERKRKNMESLNATFSKHDYYANPQKMKHSEVLNTINIQHLKWYTCCTTCRCLFKAWIPNTWGCCCRGGAGLQQEAEQQQEEAHTDHTQDDHTWDQSTGHWVHWMGEISRGWKMERERNWKQALGWGFYHELSPSLSLAGTEEGLL